MSRGSEYTRRKLQQIDDMARGMGLTLARTAAQRQAEISIVNRHLLPEQIVDDGQPETPQSVLRSQAFRHLQSATGEFAFLSGYSAEAGTDEAVPDATGRGGDTLIIMRAHGSGGGRGAAALVVLFPMTAEASGGSTGTATLTVV